MIDTHAHLNFQAFKDDYPRVIEENFRNGLRAVINVGSNFETSQKAAEIAKEFKDCYAAIGLHPIHIDDEKFKGKEYETLIERNRNKVKAIGETGLDFYHFKKNVERQKQVFLKHLFLAKKFDLPVILHCRGAKENPKDAYSELLEIVKGACPVRGPVSNGMIHCFSSDWEIGQQFLDLGFYVGFDGPITFKNADPELLLVAEKIPLDKILLETDCPFLAPEPYRGQRNEPIYVRFIAQKIAEIKKISFNDVVEQTTKNAQKLFSIKL